MITSQLEILEQARLYLKGVTQEDYVEIISPNFISSAGSHIRHIIDHYQSVISGLENNIIDYDFRLRGNKVEENPKLALERFDEIAAWMENLTSSELNQNVTLSTEVSTSNKEIQVVQSSLARELIFVGSHAVHHYAMITQISFAQSDKNNSASKANVTFGIAPATATFLREKNASPQ